MQLIAALAAGIRGAENGTVNLVLRGTSTAANYYTDFEASQQLPGTGVRLDSNGRLIAYVASLVDVVVHDSLGNDVCEFVAGAEDACVEVISPSFTGVDYTSGASGTQKPTNLEVVLDNWIASAGSPDWKVNVNGAATNISALAPVFFNVKTYGAVGNGVADDRSAITAATAAATAAGGGVVFFPAGTYRVTSAVFLPSNITWLGPGGMAAKLAVDSAGAQSAVFLTGGAGGIGGLSSIIGLWIGAINGAAPGPLISSTGGATSEVHVTDCVLGNDAQTNSFIYLDPGLAASFKIVFTRCYMRRNTGTDPMLAHLGPSRLILRDCTIVNTMAAATTVMFVVDNALIEGCTFDSSTATAGTLRYLDINPGTTSGIAIVGNKFFGNSSIFSPVAIYNSSGFPQDDCFECGNSFGGSITAHTPSLTPYAYASDGYAALNNGMISAGGHGSRAARIETYTPVGAAVTVDPKTFGTTQVRVTAGAATTVNAGSKGSMGDRWTLQIINATGAGLTVSPGTNVIFDPAVTAGTLVLNLAGFSFCTFQWMPSAGGVGNWYMVGKAVTT